MVIYNFSESFIETMKSVVYIIVIFMNNSTPFDFVESFFHFIPIKLFKIRL